jgi:exodeoxyribonuclease V beta subunit
MTFDLVNTPLNKGVTRLEASAGTGKTFALAGLFLRLVLEEKIPARRPRPNCANGFAKD